MNFAFHPAAEEKFSAAMDWYEERQPRLGMDFAIEVRAAIGWAITLQSAWTELQPGIRRVLPSASPMVCFTPLRIRACSSWRSCT